MICLHLKPNWKIFKRSFCKAVNNIEDEVMVAAGFYHAAYNEIRWQVKIYAPALRVNQAVSYLQARHT